MGLILVASRDAGEIETIKAALSVHGWWVTVAADRESVIQAAADQAPKLVLVDHDLPGSIELVRAFGTDNGGPGVLVCVAEGFDGSLELKEAGVDELITKPLSPPGLLEVVRRCLAAPRPAETERPSSAKQLLTTEEIFGDVLRELEDDPVHERAAPPPAPRAPAPPLPASGADTGRAAPAPGAPTTSPAPAAAIARDDNLFDSTPADRQVVSLAGLFDEEPEAAAAAVPEPPPEPEWNGEERRGPERPWGSSSERSGPPDVDELFADSADVEAAAAPAPPAPPALELPPTLELDREPAEALAVGEPPHQDPVLEEPPTDQPARRLPRLALVSGALAASLLVAAGVVFLKNPGADVRAAPVQIAEPVESLVVEAAPQPIESESAAVGAVSDAVEPALELPAPATAAGEPATTAVETAAAAAPIDDLDLQAIVEQELERREKDLRQVFLEEERRLLRELNKLGESEPVAEEGAGDGGDEPLDDGR